MPREHTQRIQRIFPFVTLLVAVGCSGLIAYLGREVASAAIRVDEDFSYGLYTYVWHTLGVGPGLPVVAGLLVWASPSRRRGAAWGSRFIARLAIACSVGGLLLVAAAGTKALRFPPIDLLRTSLIGQKLRMEPPGVPHTREVAAMTTTKPPSQWPRTKETTYSPGPPGQKEQTFGGLKVVQLCAEYHCELTLLPAGEDAGPPPMPSSPQFWLDWDDSVWGVLSPTEEDVFLHVGGKASVLRLTDGRYQRVDPTPKYVAARTSPPLAWLGTGLAGLFIVALIHLLRRRLRRRRSALLAARKGTLEADGRVTFEDGSVAQLEGPPALPCGPVLVLGGSAGATYRHNETLSEKDMLTGTVDEHLEELRLRVLRYNAAAACVACLSAAPLVGALLVGLVV